ncbi:multidrug transporter, partial [Periconia macrospinosa]
HRRSTVPRADGKRELREKDCWDKLAYSWPKWKKAMYLASIAGIQISMNFNTSVYPSAVNPISEHFGVSTQKARIGQMIYLVAYSFGCELWAPWSEEFGRWPILQLSLFFINIWQIPASVAPNFATIIVCRGLGGLSTAGGSVTLGLVADLYEPETQHWPLLFVVLSSTIGTSIGGVIGGPIEHYLTWQWNFWIQLIFGVAVQAVHFFMPESRSTILIDREAKRRRETGEDPNVYGPNELKTPRISLKEAGKIWLRPFEMFIREPIVLFLSLLSGFSDALIFTFLEAFAITFPDNFNFGTLQVAWAFIPINASYFFTYFLYWPWFWRDEHLRKKNGLDSMSPERRLKPLLLLALFEPIGLFGFAWTCMGPPQTHWIAPMIFSFLVGLANFAIYYSSVDYMIAAYGPYSASATGGNAFARDFLAGIAAMYATPLYTNLSETRPSELATTILACLSCVGIVPIYIFYWKGPQIRNASKF